MTAISVALPDDLRERVEALRASVCLSPRTYGFDKRPSTSDVVRLALQRWCDSTAIRPEHMDGGQ